ncbi:hypothetical protein HPP92_007028 [Vanilla planifolia]|uniref:Uncharacterized protein n=1 Tax=Vanilla planifolia TaxID=51239 RepID=A0A835VAW1_VANPL|nr:hypothetical protein HPP92_007028 [Vanilla planifolia]
MEPGVKQALLVGIGIQILQQFSGINGVIYYTPQILEQAGVAMRLMDLSGRRFLLLSTIPVLVFSLLVLIIANIVEIGTMAHAMLSTGPRRLHRHLCAFFLDWRHHHYILSPVMLSSIGLVGAFGVYTIVCIIAFVFIFLKVPETKRMALEVITEFFAFDAEQKRLLRQSTTT